MGLVFAALVPHPPVLVPEVGGAVAAEVRSTEAAMERVAQLTVESRADALVIVTPHGSVEEAAACLYEGRRLEGDLTAFGVPDVSLAMEMDENLADALRMAMERLGLTLIGLPSMRLDHGALVPLYFLSRTGIVPCGLVITPPLNTAVARRCGEAMACAAQRSGRRVALIASGDCSHRLTPGAPAGFSPAGRLFDQRLVEFLQRGDAEGALYLPFKLVYAAGQDVLPSLAVLAGALSALVAGRGEGVEEGIASRGRFRPRRSKCLRAEDTSPQVPPIKGELLSYEAPFGVGYAVAVWTVDALQQ